VKLEATFQWNRALANDPDEDLKPKIELKLVEGLPEEDGAVPATANGDLGTTPSGAPELNGAGSDKKGSLEQDGIPNKLAGVAGDRSAVLN
jgi:hypothetical protein